MAILIHIILVYSLAGSVLFPQKQNKTHYSPNKGLRPIVIPVGNKGFEDQESRIEIRDSAGKLLRWRSFASSDGEHGRGIKHAEWTADGQFFIFNAPSSGGHQPWNLATYFYSRRNNKFYSLDDYIGPITSDFKLEGRNTIKATRMNFQKGAEEEAVTVRLEQVERRSLQKSASNKRMQRRPRSKFLNVAPVLHRGPADARR
jgi:hypothetical protein